MITLNQTSVVVLFSVRDTANAVVTPLTAKWSLYDEDGLIVNGRENVAITPATEMSIVLSGDDLPYELSNNQLTVLIETTYSSSYGTLTAAKKVEIVTQRRT